MDICTECDNFIRDYQEMNPHWIVWLSSGLAVYQDDGRPGFSKSAWERLHDYCKENNDYIVDMSFGFRDNKRSLPSKADGYFFCKGAMGCFGMKKTIQHYIVGTLKDNKLVVTRWRVPEMFEQETEQRDPEKAGICLIKRNTNQSLEQRV